MPPPAAAIFSLLLILTGISKLRRPNDTARALRAMRIPMALVATGVVAVAEIVIGVGALVTRQPALFAGQAILYAAFLAWVATALVKDIPIASCGCLGREDTPPYVGHLVLNAIAIFASAGAALTGPVEVSGPLQLMAITLPVLVGAALAWIVLDEGARISGLMSR